MLGPALGCRTPEDEVCAADGGEATEVDDGVVAALVQEAIATGAAQWPESPTDAAQAAWYDVLTRRNRAPQDVNLAAAEHYLYARYSAMEDGPVGGMGMAVLAAGYDAVKAVAFGLGVEDWLSTDGTTPSRPTVGSARWGVAGAIDGSGN
jgi:hypothetical protein